MLSAGSYNMLTGKSGWECGWGRSEVPHRKRAEAAAIATTLVVSFTHWST